MDLVEHKFFYPGIFNPKQTGRKLSSRECWNSVQIRAHDPVCYDWHFWLEQLKNIFRYNSHESIAYWIVHCCSRPNGENFAKTADVVLHVSFLIMLLKRRRLAIMWDSISCEITPGSRYNSCWCRRHMSRCVKTLLQRSHPPFCQTTRSARESFQLFRCSELRNSTFLVGRFDPLSGRFDPRGQRVKSAGYTRQPGEGPVWTCES